MITSLLNAVDEALFSYTAQVAITGLDNAGKTTLVHVLCHDKLAVHRPTIHPQTEACEVGNMSLHLLDFGGMEYGKVLWCVNIHSLISIYSQDTLERFP